MFIHCVIHKDGSVTNRAKKAGSYTLFSKSFICYYFLIGIGFLDIAIGILFMTLCIVVKLRYYDLLFLKLR